MLLTHNSKKQIKTTNTEVRVETILGFMWNQHAQQFEPPYLLVRKHISQIEDEICKLCTDLATSFSSLACLHLQLLDLRAI
jgi:hypothetical protein